MLQWPKQAGHNLSIKKKKKKQTNKQTKWKILPFLHNSYMEKFKWNSIISSSYSASGKLQ